MPHSLLNDLVEWWSLDNPEQIGKGELNKFNLNPSGAFVPITGKVGGAVSFPNFNSTLITPHHPDLSIGSNDFTFAAWALYNGRSTDFFTPPLASKWLANPTGREWRVEYDTRTKRMVFKVCMPDGVTQPTIAANSFGEVPLNVWFFVKAYYDSVLKTINIRINNGPIESLAINASVYTPPVPQPYRISGATSASGSTQHSWPGAADNVAIWRRLLDQSEDDYLFNAGTGRPYSDLLV